MQHFKQAFLQFQILSLLLFNVHLNAEQPYELSEILAGLVKQMTEHENQTQSTIENLKKERDYYKQLIENDTFTVRHAASLSTNFNDIFGHTLTKLRVQETLRRWNYIFWNAGNSNYSRIQILSGAYGNGKDLLAKAMIKASGQNFIHIQNFPSRMNLESIEQLFFTARKQGNCIIFIEDFDRFIKNRLYDENGKAGEVFNFFMSELNKLNENKESVVFLATTRNTNFVTSSLSCKFLLELIYPPSPQERYEFLKLHLFDMQPEDDFIQYFATQTKTFSYSQLAKICLVSKIAASEEGLSCVKKHDLEHESNKIKNLTNSSIRSHDKLYKTSIHEASHAIIGMHFKLAVIMANILPNGSSVGRCKISEIDEKCPEFLQKWIYMCLAGETGVQEFQLPKEDIFIYENGLENFLSRKGSSGDILQARKAARKLLLLQDKEKFLDDNQQIDEIKLNLKIDEIIATSYHHVQKIIHEKKDLIKKFADELFEREILYKNDIYNIINP